MLGAVVGRLLGNVEGFLLDKVVGILVGNFEDEAGLEVSSQDEPQNGPLSSNCGIS